MQATQVTGRFASWTSSTFPAYSVIEINGKLLQWLDSLLASRSMKVGLRGTSQILQVLSGVPKHFYSETFIVF